MDVRNARFEPPHAVAADRNGCLLDTDRVAAAAMKQTLAGFVRDAAATAASASSSPQPDAGTCAATLLVPPPALHPRHAACFRSTPALFSSLHHLLHAATWRECHALWNPARNAATQQLARSTAVPLAACWFEALQHRVPHTTLYVPATTLAPYDAPAGDAADAAAAPVVVGWSAPVVATTERPDNGAFFTVCSGGAGEMQGVPLSATEYHLPAFSLYEVEVGDGGGDTVELRWVGCLKAFEPQGNGGGGGGGGGFARKLGDMVSAYLARGDARVLRLHAAAEDEAAARRRAPFRSGTLPPEAGGVCRTLSPRRGAPRPPPSREQHGDGAGAVATSTLAGVRHAEGVVRERLVGAHAAFVTGTVLPARAALTAQRRRARAVEREALGRWLLREGEECQWGEMRHRFGLAQAEHEARRSLEGAVRPACEEIVEVVRVAVARRTKLGRKVARLRSLRDEELRAA
eukprot:Rhum_TRINITY_DN4383_c0_g1::Rhum_TRINITY_DN4383_c0_g1_i1::g.14118::m.14118